MATSIQIKASEAGVESLKNVSVSSVKHGQPTVTVKEAKDNQLPVDTDDDDDSASRGLTTLMSLAVVLLSATMLIG